MKSTPELLLPVGTSDMLLAAIHNGADAVYIGVPGFNARGRSQDFSLEDLKEMIQTCHLYGVKVHLAFNVLVFETEWERARDLLCEILPLAPDAFIVQDLGLAQMIRAMAPWQRIHGSTQMTVTNHDAMSLLDDLSIDRFVLGRENSLPEIAKIRENTSKEIEVFVHGALCVAYSGQCFTSESLGGRSANRGQCAQSCRLDYELFVDGEKRDLGNKKYLVSPQDLCGIEELPALIEMGVDSFKIEGRLKTPEYVATCAREYKDVINHGVGNAAKRRHDLALTYSRGLFSGWLHGVDHQKLVPATSSSHRGLLLGQVVEVKKRSVLIAIQSEELPRQGQGLLFENNGIDIGANIFSVKAISQGRYEVELFQFDHTQLKSGISCYVNSDQEVTKRARQSFESRELLKRLWVDVAVRAMVDQALSATMTDEFGVSVTVALDSVVQAARAKSCSDEFFQDELSSLGTTPFKLRTLSVERGGAEVFVANSQLKELRRQLVARLMQKRVERIVPVVKQAPLPSCHQSEKKSSLLNLVLRSRRQVEALVSAQMLWGNQRHYLGVVFLDFEFGQDYAPSLEILRSCGIKAGIATTRILKPSEYHHLKLMVRLGPDAILVRNLGALHWLSDKGIPLHGDFSLNAANSMTANYLLSKGLESINLSYDLNGQQLLAMLPHLPTEKVEVTLHQYMPEFHMEHCVFAAFLSTGSSFRDCGKPCEKHRVELKDAYGNMHFLHADQECRNTMFRGTPQSAAFLKDQLSDLGVGYLRLEALHESSEVLIQKVVSYLQFIAGQISLPQLLDLVGTQEKYGVFEGMLASKQEWRDRKKGLQDI